MHFHHALSPLLAARPATDAHAPHAASATPPPWQQHHLPAAAAVQPLAVPHGCMAVLESTQGRLWLTQEGELSDHLLEAGQRLYCHGPARLYLGAEGASPAAVRWMLLPRGSHAPA
ncbi:MAG: DUF2917 domain-containing protein [Comamonas sp.]